jgi:hypothetical protein
MIKIAGAVLLAALLCQDKANPDYEYWSECKPGSWVKSRMEFENQGKMVEYETVTRLLEITPEKAVVELLRRLKTGDKSIDSPPQKAEIKAKGAQSGTTVTEKDEEITISGKTLKCRYYEIETESPDKKTKTVVKAWMSKEIPGGAARSEVTSPQLKGPIRVTALEWEKK